MKFYLAAAFAIAAFSARSQNTSDMTEKIRVNASTFHKNFSTGEFEKNGPLVTENIYVNSNNAILVGRDNFVHRIERFKVPFPGLKLRDRIVLIDGNNAAVNYVMQATQTGPFGPIPPSGNKVEVMGAEFFVMNSDALMENLLTITQLDVITAECKGEKKVDQFQNITLLPLPHEPAGFKQMLKDAIDNYVGAFNARNWDELSALIADNVQVNWNGNMEQGKAALMAELKKYLTAIPDLTWEIDRNIVDGDRSAIAYTMLGKQSAALDIDGATIASTGKSLSAREAQYFQYDSNGKIISVIAVSNTNDIGMQLK